jgi:two-component system chemotaxis sensor kinase CheA
MNLDQALQTFIVESRELLEDMEGALLGIRDVEDRSGSINAIFRAAHTIKGSAGLFGLDQIVEFTHVVESVLDRVREGTVAIDDGLVALLLECSDHMGGLIGALAAGHTERDAGADERAEPLLQRLRALLGEAPAATAPAPARTAEAGTPAAADGPTGADHWHISLRFGREVLRNGMDPLSFLRYLKKLGEITGLVTLPYALPPLADMDPEACYLGFEIGLKSSADKAAIEGTFEFVIDDCQVRILPPNSRVSEYIALLQQVGEEPTRLGEILVNCGSVTARELADALAQQQQAVQHQPLGQILVEHGAVQPAVLDAALTRQKQVKEIRSPEGQSIRVDADKLDHLINLVGELITAGAGASLAARRSRNVEVQEANSQLASLVQEVRDSALQLRMVKIGATFSRFRRVVHDVSREIGKDIELMVRGEDTELDKTVVEKIGDPLTHLVRNAMDHGIENAETRVARGKPAHGTVTLNAYHDSGSIVIEVSDDGGGLNRERILAKAMERGLVEPGRTLSDSETYGLIFEPGFSTAEQITNLSGRGVGMDVVKKNITALRGTVDVTSEPGVGTTVILRLPLTLAIIDGFLVGLGRSSFVIPLEMIEECIEFSAETGKDYTDLRGQVLPLIRLRDTFRIEGAAGARQSIVVIKHAGKRTGIVVDALLGEFQTVIKPLNRMFGQVKCISGSTILGSGEVALILDAPALIHHAALKDADRHASVRGMAESGVRTAPVGA